MAAGVSDPYEALGVARDASDKEIRAAYRRLAREYHPDVNKDPGAEDRFKEVSEAYDILRDPEKRERYDRGGAQGQRAGAGPGGPDMSGFEGFGGFGDGVRFDFGGGDGDDLGDIFEGLFGGGRGGRGRRGRGGGF